MTNEIEQTAEENQQPPPAGEEGGGAGDIAQEERAKSRQLESSHYSVVSQIMADGRIMVGPDIELFPGKECKMFANPGTTAYEAKDRRLGGE